MEEGERELGRKGLRWCFVEGPGVKLQALGHSPGEHVPKLFFFSTYIQKFNSLAKFIFNYGIC